MSSRSALRNAACVAALVTLGALTACGQRGPLTLPDSAKPIERLDPNAARPDAANPPSAAPQESEQPDDERNRNER